jgi:hypothetical protein
VYEDGELPERVTDTAEIYDIAPAPVGPVGPMREVPDPQAPAVLGPKIVFVDVLM